MTGERRTRPGTAELLERSAAGDDEAFRRLVEAHEADVYRLALALLGDPTAARDAAQEAFVRLHGSLDTFRGEARLSTWLHRVTVNLCHDERRRAKRAERLVSLDAAAPTLVVFERDPDESLEREELMDRIRAALERLPAEQREAIVLRYLGELSYAEISEAVGAAANTVASRVYRGLRQLGNLLGAEPGLEEVS